MLEETGVHADKSQLTLVEMMRSKAPDPITGTTNNALRAVYAYRYDGAVEDLRVEHGKAIGFEKWPIEAIFNLSDADKKRFIPLILTEQTLSIFRKIQQLV